MSNTTPTEVMVEAINFYRHGGPYDRGRADSYYQRPFRPHYFVGNTHMSEEIGQDRMTLEECKQYICGWRDNQAAGNFKEYE